MHQLHFKLVVYDFLFADIKRFLFKLLVITRLVQVFFCRDALNPDNVGNIVLAAHRPYYLRQILAVTCWNYNH